MTDEPKVAMCRRFKATKDFPEFFEVGVILVETYPKSCLFRPEDAPPGDLGFDMRLLERNPVMKNPKNRLLEFWEPLDSAPFQETKNFDMWRDVVLEDVPNFEELVQHRIDLFKGTDLESPLHIIARGLKCLKGDHELKPCQMGHASVWACPHCGHYQKEPPKCKDDEHKYERIEDEEGVCRVCITCGDLQEGEEAGDGS